MACGRNVDCRHGQVAQRAAALTSAPASDRPPPERSKRHSSLSVAAPAAAVLVAVVAVVAAYLISHTSTPRSALSSAPAALPSPAYPAPALGGALSPEAGPDGMPWQWIGQAASLQLASPKPSWIAFRALSPRIGRALTFTGSGGERVTVHIATAPGVYLAGPLAAGTVLLRPRPVTALGRGVPPSPAVFLSTPRVMPNPVAVMPGAGFWSTESAGGVVFNWLRRSGVIDVYSPRTPSGSASLAFLARSLGQRRIVTARGAGTSSRATVTTTARPVTLGPFRLVGGRARIVFRVSPGPRRYGADPRPISVQVAGLGAYTTGTEG